VAAGAVDLDRVREGRRGVGESLGRDVEILAGLGGLDGGFDGGEGLHFGAVGRWGRQGVLEGRGGVGVELVVEEGREGGAV